MLQPVKVPMNSSTTLWLISRSFWSCIVIKLAEGALCPVIQVIRENVKLYGSQNKPQGTQLVRIAYFFCGLEAVMIYSQTVLNYKFCRSAIRACF